MVDSLRAGHSRTLRPTPSRLRPPFRSRRQIWLFATAGLSASLLVLCLLLNAFKAIAYNARSRAVNGAIIVVALFTILGAAADFSNTAAYIPLLNLCAAIQTAHYFATHRADRSWIAIAAICLAYTTLFLCQILI